jgi:hypothetical protein
MSCPSDLVKASYQLQDPPLESRDHSGIVEARPQLQGLELGDLVEASHHMQDLLIRGQDPTDLVRLAATCKVYLW